MQTVKMDYGDSLISIELPDSATVVEYGKNYTDPKGIDPKEATRKALDNPHGFAPLKDVYKTKVYDLCRYRNSLGKVIPERVLTRPPTAELAPDQVDQDSLPSYDILDSILQQYIELDTAVVDIIQAGYDADQVADVLMKVDRNEYKRRQAPPGVKVTERAFGRDRRYPITSGYGNTVN